MILQMDELILKQLKDRLCEVADELGFHKLRMRTDGCISEVYVINKHAIQLEIDWHENNLFMYVVYLKNQVLPDKNVVYNYTDGQWCRKYIEEIYGVNRPPVKANSRYSADYLFDCFEFYLQLINRNPGLIKDFGEEGET